MGASQQCGAGAGPDDESKGGSSACGRCCGDRDVVARNHIGEEALVAGMRSHGQEGGPVNSAEPDKNTVSSSSRPVPATTPSTTEEKGPDGEGELNYFDREKEELASINGKQGLKSGAIYRFRSGATYNGQWGGGMRHGYGKMVWADGVTYEGQWKENVATGKGSFQHIDGDQYIGEWSCNKANGMGVYYHGGIQTYVGEWCDDCQHGSGIESWSEGASYQGEFKKNQKDGFGRYQWEGGSCEYLGRWTNNVIEGYGMCIAADGRLFMGFWRQSAMHGIGKYMWPDGKEYSGQYCYDKKDGFGVLKDSNGEVTTGFWTQGAPEPCKSSKGGDAKKSTAPIADSKAPLKQGGPPPAAANQAGAKPSLR